MKHRMLGIVLIVILGLTGCSKKEPLPPISEWDRNQDPYFKVQFNYPKGWFKGSESGKMTFTSSSAAVEKFFDPTSKDAPDGAQILVSYEKQDTLKTLDGFVEAAELVPDTIKCLQKGGKAIHTFPGRLILMFHFLKNGF